MAAPGLRRAWMRLRRSLGFKPRFDRRVLEAIGLFTEYRWLSEQGVAVNDGRWRMQVMPDGAIQVTKREVGTVKP